jgi:hypothetical protein
MLPPQSEGGTFLGRDFMEAVEKLTSAAPTASHVEKKKRKKDIETEMVKDSKDLDS